MDKMEDIFLVVFDCDGVLLESVDVKTKAFGQTVAEHGQNAVDSLVKYHLENGGVSRYKKFEWFYQKILGKNITDRELEILGDRFKRLSFEGVMNAPMVPGAREVLEAFANKVPMSVASGTPHDELVRILETRELSVFFDNILGSPPGKTQLLQRIIDLTKISSKNVLMVGDSMTDLEAAENCGTQFFGRGNIFQPLGKPWSNNLEGLLVYLKKRL